MPRFSIIIPVYNVAPYLRECLDSVVAQTFADWEAICVDDGSTDGSGAILDEYAAKDNRFRVIHQANAGVSAARNAALDVARGEWICFIDADDIWHRDFLFDSTSAIACHSDCKLLRHDVVRFKDGMPCDFGCEEPRFQEKDISGEVSFEDFSGHYFWEHVYRRDVVGSIRFPPYKRGEDRVFFDSILLNHSDKLVTTNASRYGYRIRPGSAMNSLPSAKVIVDELQHRRDIVYMIETCAKTVPYAGSRWLEGYFTDGFAGLAAVKPAEERKLLWHEWYKCVKDMRDAKGLSTRTRRIYLLACLLPCRPVWWFIVRLLPWYRRHGLLPRLVRRVRKYWTKP